MRNLILHLGDKTVELHRLASDLRGFVYHPGETTKDSSGRSIRTPDNAWELKRLMVKGQDVLTYGPRPLKRAMRADADFATKAALIEYEKAVLDFCDAALKWAAKGVTENYYFARRQLAVANLAAVGELDEVFA